MPISNYEGKTFVAFLDISGFKELMRRERAFEALDCLYNAGYRTLRNQNGNRVEGIFISDCGVLFVRNNQDRLNQADDLHSILEVIRRINEIMIRNDFMLTTSIAYGNFKYQERIEFEGMEKNLIVGNAYLEAFLDNENGNPKIQPGQCRLIETNLQDILNDERFRAVCKRSGNDKHYYYYWMVSTSHEIGRFENEYKDTYNLKYAGMLNVIKGHQHRQAATH
jgi:hypothetical protein